MRIKKLELSDDVDDDEEMEISTYIDYSDYSDLESTAWINKADALKIINHLQSVFKLQEVEECSNK